MDLGPMQRRSRHLRMLVALLLVLGLPSATCGWHWWINRDRGAASVRVAIPSVLREDPAPGVIHLHLQGDGYALGFAQGTATRAEIQDMARFLREQMLGTGLLGNGTRDWLLMTAWKLDAFMPPKFREELRGMADASAVSYADLLLINTFDDLNHVSGCSSAVIEGRDGSALLHGRNLDYPIAHLAGIKLVRDINHGGVVIRTIGFPGFIGALTGMSSRGLALSSHTSASRRNQVGEPSAILYRRLLEDSHSLAEMEAAVRAARRTMGNNLALSDGVRNLAVALEFDASLVEVRQPDRGRLFVTNHFWSAALQGHQPEGWWAPASGSQARVHCLDTALAAGRGTDRVSLQDALAQEGPGTAWRTPANRGTVQSVVMEPSSGRLWLASGLQIPVTRGGYLAVRPAW